MTRIEHPAPKCLALSMTLALLFCPASASARNNGTTSKAVAANTAWMVDKTTHLSHLTIAPGGTLKAAPGDSLTLTVDGVGLPIRAGDYAGDVVVTASKDIIVPFNLIPGVNVGPYHFRTAIYVDGGKLVPEKSVAAADPHGKVTDTSADGVSITSKEQDFNGIIVTGDSRYTINRPTIHLVGNGGNDFAGFGAAIMASGNAHLTVNHAHISTRGAVRTAVFVGGNSVVTVNDSDIETRDGVLPADYRFSILPGKMMEVPYGLGISGNLRATNLMGHGTVYYNHDHIRAEAWGALSSDGDGPTHMVATDSLIEAVKSGYGAYANGDAHDEFRHCVFNVADYGLVIGGPGSGTFTDRTVVNSRRFGVMMHQGTGGGTLTIENGSVFNTRSTAIEVKGRGTHIVVVDAQLHPGNGIILQTMDNDDPIMREMAAHKEGMPGGAGSHPSFSGNVVADFRNVALKGNIYHAMTDVGSMQLSFEHATLAGAISLSTTHPASGREPTRATFRQIGDVKNTLGPNGGKYGLDVLLGPGTRWVVDQTSYLTGLKLVDGAVVTAPAGKRVVLTVDGVKTALKVGNYAGRIVLEVVPAGSKG